MINITIPFDPVPWAAPRLSRYHSYDPKEKDKRAASYIISEQYSGHLITDYTVLEFLFCFSVPKSTSKKNRALMLKGNIIPTRCDCTNLQKLYEDCLKKIVIDDDRKVAKITSQKIYAEKGSVNIVVYTLKEYMELGNAHCHR